MPILHGVVLGGEERYGYLDGDGNFVEDIFRGGFQVELLPISDDLAIPNRSRAEILDLQGEPVAELFIGVIDGEIACIAIKALPGKALTGEILRQTPIATLVRKAAQAHIVHLRNGFAVRFAQGNPFFSPRSEVPAPERRILNKEFLLRVADIYRIAIATGEAPAKAVEQELGPTTPENARRWIMAARKEGLLGQSKGSGRKGELSSQQALRNHPAEL